MEWGQTQFWADDQLLSYVEFGGNPNAVNERGVTILHGCAKEQRLAVVRLLLGAGADVLAKDAEGRTPLDDALQPYASEKINPELITLLKAAASKAEALGKKGGN
jgi:hypothetical protein